MSRSRAIRTAVMALLRQPLVIIAEIAWRWALATALLLLSAYALLLFLHSTPVTNGDMFGLSGIVPSLFRQTVAHIFSGSGPRLLRVVVVLSAGFSALWWLAVSLGRAATLQALVKRADSGQPGLQLGSMFKLHALRVLFGFASALSWLGAFIFAASVSGMHGAEALNSRAVGKFYLIFLPLTLIMSALSSAIQWYLSLATVMAATAPERKPGVLSCIAGAAQISKARATQFAWVGFVSGGFRLMLYSAAFFLLMAILGLMRELPGGIVIGLLVLFALVYAAFSALIHLVRLAAYVRVVEWNPEEEGAPSYTVANCELQSSTEPGSMGIVQLEPPPSPAG